jgi:hypothetical protein
VPVFLREDLSLFLEHIRPAGSAGRIMPDRTNASAAPGTVVPGEERPGEEVFDSSCNPSSHLSANRGNGA